MSKREVPKLNSDNFAIWQSLIKLHLRSIGDHAQILITVDHKDPVGPLTAEDLSKKEHNQAMLEITSALSYAEYDDIKGCDTKHKMQTTLSTIYGGYENIQRAEREGLRGNFDDKMEEEENATQYGARMKEVVSAI